MSSGIDPSIPRALDLLGNLKKTAADFAKREEQFTRDIQHRRMVSSRKSQDATGRTDAQLEARVASIEEHYKAEGDRVSAIYEKRRTRVQRHAAAALRNLPRRAQEEKGRWMGDLQMKGFLAQRKLEADFAAADAAYNEFAGKLEVYRTTLKDVKARASKAFGGYMTLRSQLGKKSAAAGAMASGDHIADLGNYFATAEEQLAAFKKLAIPRFFAVVPFPVLFVLILLGGAAAGFFLHASQPNAYVIAGGGAAALAVIVWIIHFMGYSQSKPAAKAVISALASARGIIEVCGGSAAAAAAKHAEDRAQIQAEHDRTLADIQSKWGRADEVEVEYARRMRRKLETQPPRIVEKIEKILQPKLARIDAERRAQAEGITGEAGALKGQYAQTHASESAALDAEEQGGWTALATDWKQAITPIYQQIDAMNAAVAGFPAWSQAFVDKWAPSDHFTPFTKFGHLDLDIAKQPGSVPRDPRLALPGPSQVSVPAVLAYPNQGSLLFESRESGGETVIGTLNNVILRLLATTPPGKVAFTIIDPVGLGRNFAGLMHLSDYEESIINRRIWTQRDQIEQRLEELSDHIEKVIQMYLRNEYANITEYNEQAGSVAEKYHFLVVSDFPANFSDIAAKRLQSIAASGPRCGIYTLMQWDQRQQQPDGFVPDELRKNSICLKPNGREWTLGGAQTDLGATLVFDPPPASELAVELVHKIGKSSIDSNRVEVPFSQIAPPPEEMWTGDTTNELRVAIGRTGATKLQYLAIGKGTRQHALFAGKTGSGKSTLFHVIITNLALSCSPDQVEFYLIDFKKGVEFKCYAEKQLPHAKVIAIESDREFALSVLQRVDAELRRRGDMFRKLGVQDVAGYKRAGGTEPMPRSLLLIDEFQEFFVEDDPIAQTASLLFDRIVRQGRAFGIHVLLGSQTLGGAYSLARATLGQMVIRVALQCNEADAYLIMDENNSAPRLLSRPGEGIYNDASGAVEGNSPFQVVWLPDQERDEWLDKVHELSARKGPHAYPTPIVFEGNAPADIRENDPLQIALETPPAAAPAGVSAWLGAPNSIKGPTEAVFRRQSGNNLLIVGQREESAATMLGLSMIALAAQYPRGAAKFVLFQGAAPGTAEANFLDEVVKAIPHEVRVTHGHDAGEVMNDLATELKARSGTHSPDAPAIFLFIHGLQRFKKLRHEDDFSFSTGGDDAAPDPGAQLGEIITEGAGAGIFIATSVDTLNSVNRFMNRKALAEFEMRVVFQMSANDSASLIDSPAASNLGLHRAILFNEHEGYTETFRPYAMPDNGWIREAAGKLARKPASPAPAGA